VPRTQTCESARRLRDTYAITPGTRLVRREHGFYSLDRWKEEGMPQGIPLADLFDYDPPGHHTLEGLGWCEAAFEPAFEVKIVEDRGDYVVEQDIAGRHVLYFKGRRQGFMPQYLEHPVTDIRSWVENVRWRLDPATPARYADLDSRMQQAQEEAALGKMISQRVIGGYMYLRSLIGPERVLYAFYDMPDLVHDCMEVWLDLAEATTARHQQYVTIDEVFLAEDICYNHGPLISPRMMKEFLFPYYQQLIGGIKRRQIDASRHLYVQVDTDGHAPSVIPLYIEAIDMDAMCPFEVAADCDVVALGHQYPGLAVFGGIDKRVLARGRHAIDDHLERILPTMRARGGYIPTCDHGVPPEVPYKDYLYYRQRCIELGG
jgi:uroporphyrinogen decarboxylase